ncbi:C-reactive protein-like [Amblyraja radiata]|uniref:C-reactive protein-like n=1 Tax=Amblyraja radiata TaxID=386614 RepID=UPI0014038D00|nr:C-reactive protein-like [Amblyraja radiata]
MKPFATIVLVVCIYLSGSDSAGLYGKSVKFQTETDNSFVRLNAHDFTGLTAFTVCFRAGTENTYQSLFSYATSSSANELLIWQETKTQLWLYLGSYEYKFYIPEMNSLPRHICVTWESKGGEIIIWVNVRCHVREVHVREGQVVKGSGESILGQDQDSVGGGFDASQSYVGEITDVNMWDRVLKPNEIMLIIQVCFNAGGNIIDWGSTTFTTGGNVIFNTNNNCPVLAELLCLVHFQTNTFPPLLVLSQVMNVIHEDRAVDVVRLHFSKLFDNDPTVMNVINEDRAVDVVHLHISKLFDNDPMVMNVINEDRAVDVVHLHISKLFDNDRMEGCHYIGKGTEEIRQDVTLIQRADGSRSSCLELQNFGCWLGPN